MNPKFRIWDKINKCWATDFTLSLEGELLCDGGTTLFIKENFELMQWSGYKDRDGKDIYAGDILHLYADTDYSGEYYPYFVGLKDYGWLAWDDGGDSEAIADVHDSAQILGNIYENPEMDLEQDN